jgi:hypothetical protein
VNRPEQGECSYTMGGDLWMHFNETDESREAREAYNLQNTGEKGPEESSANMIEWDCSAGSVQIDLSDLIDRQQPTGSGDGAQSQPGASSKKSAIRKLTMGQGASAVSTQLFNGRDPNTLKDAASTLPRPGVPTPTDGVPPLTAEVSFEQCESSVPLVS